jgi:hypothetical protein
MTLSFKKVLPIIAVLAITLLYFLFDAREGGFPRCPFYLLTGLKCPGCGSQRAFSALLHGDLGEAFRYNLLLLLFLPLLLLAGINFIFSLWDKQLALHQLFYSNRVVYLVLFLVILFWIVRNIPGFWLNVP